MRLFYFAGLERQKPRRNGECEFCVCAVDERGGVDFRNILLFSFERWRNVEGVVLRIGDLKSVE